MTLQKVKTVDKAIHVQWPECLLRTGKWEKGRNEDN